MEKHYNSRRLNELDDVFACRIYMLREYYSNKWNDKIDQANINACLAAQKLAYVDEGIDLSENNYNKVDSFVAYIANNQNILKEIYGENVDIKKIDTQYIDDLSDKYRMHQDQKILEKHAYGDKNKKAIKYINVKDALVSLENYRTGVEIEKEINSQKKQENKERVDVLRSHKRIRRKKTNDTQMAIPFDYERRR